MYKKVITAVLVFSVLTCGFSISLAKLEDKRDNKMESLQKSNGKSNDQTKFGKDKLHKNEMDKKNCIGSLSKEDKEIQIKINQYMDAAAANNNFHGAVLVEKDGKILLSKGYGMSDYENSVPNKSNTRFAIGSITKQFTAMAIMQLYEKGAIKLDTKINKFFPDFPRGNEITIHHLLTHTSGIVNYTQLGEFYNIPPEELSFDNITKLLYSNPLDFNPGEKWNYSNSGYILLERIVEKLSGKSLEDYLEKNIFKPLDMKNTGACLSKGKVGIRTKGYIGYLDIQPIDDTISYKIAGGAGFLYSTVEDLYKWDRALYTNKIVSKKTIDLIFTPFAHTFMGEYGYGWYVKGEGVDRLVFHDGILAGFHSNISRYVGRNQGVIILSNNNMGGSGVYKIDSAINSILQGENVEIPALKATITLEDQEIDKIIGVYEIMQGVNINITRDSNHIYAELTGDEKKEIFASSRDEFFTRTEDSTITFVRNNMTDQVVSLVAKRNGTDYYAIKQ